MLNVSREAVNEGASEEKFSGVGPNGKKQDRKIAPLGLPLLYQYYL